jgi:hypothetical protein
MAHIQRLVYTVMMLITPAELTVNARSDPEKIVNE